MNDLDFGETLKGFSPGQKAFNRYTLKKILGRGGMGIVWLGRDEELERDVALKFLPEVVALDKEAIRDLKRETRRSLELTHPHIVRIYDFVQDARMAAISMEYVAGDTLASRKVDHPEGRFEVEELKAWTGQLLEALAYAHGKAEVVHRDLKPANLMVDARGDLKVADFGIAASVSDSASRVSAQAGTSGTPVYMSPQQMMGEKPAVTDDIYALGATLYDLLTGKPPFHAGNIILQVQNKVPPTLTERRAELGVKAGAIPAEWEETIVACLAKEPGARPQSAAEMAERLGLTTKDTKSAKRIQVEAGESGAEGRAKPPAEPVPQAKIEKPKSKISPLALAAGVLLLAGAGYYFGYYAPAQKRQTPEVIEREKMEVSGGRAAYDVTPDLIKGLGPGDDITPVPVDERHATDDGGLYYAVAINDRALMAQRLAAGANPLEGGFISSIYGIGIGAPLQAALRDGRFLLVRELLRRSPKPDPQEWRTVDGYRMSFATACGTGNWDMIQLFLDFHPVEWELDAWLGLLETKKPELLERAVRAGADPNYRDNRSGATPLHKAAADGFNDAAMLRAFINLGADIKAKDKSGKLPFDLLSADAPAEIRRLLTPAGGQTMGAGR